MAPQRLRSSSAIHIFSRRPSTCAKASTDSSRRYSRSCAIVAGDPSSSHHTTRTRMTRGYPPDGGTIGVVQTVSPPTSSARLPRSVAACLAAILEIDVADVPVPEDAHPEPWTVWRNWLAQRALGLVPIAEPAAFSWPGPWLALLRAADGDGHVGAVAFGAPPGLAWVALRRQAGVVLVDAAHRRA